MKADLEDVRNAYAHVRVGELMGGGHRMTFGRAERKALEEFDEFIESRDEEIRNEGALNIRVQRPFSMPPWSDLLQGLEDK